MSDPPESDVTSAVQREVAALPDDIQASHRGLIALALESARRFDAGVDAAGSRVQRTLTELRRAADRWERLTLPAAGPVTEERSQLDELRARRAAREGEVRPG